MNADDFSVRWTKFQYFDGGGYTFYATSDDGIRVWVDEQLIIDRWYDHAEATFSAARSLSAGYHSMRVEYYDARDKAVARVWWDGGSSPAPSGDWQAEYYPNTWLGGSPILVRTESAVEFRLGLWLPRRRRSGGQFLGALDAVGLYQYRRPVGVHRHHR